MANITTGNNFSEQKQESTVQVKQEKKDDANTTQSSSGEISNIIVNNPQLSQLQARNVTITVAVSTSSSSGQSETVTCSKSSAPTQPKPATVSAPSKKVEEPPPIDFPSICGSFGWTTIGSVHLPFIMRGEDRFVAVRMVESKIISKYADILPWTVFTCTNIKSYYITENEAKLFNEINGYHCEFQFGYQTFSAKDVVVRLGDTVKFYEFLESCRTKLLPHGGHPTFKDKCGFIMVNCTAVPYLSKGSNKYVPLNMVYPEGVSPPVPATEKVTEWDLAYLRFLCFVANLDQRKLKAGIALCCLEDLQNALGLCFEEWWPSLPLNSKSGRTYLSSPPNGALPKWGGPLQIMQASSPHDDSSHKLRDNVSEVPVRENVFNPFIKADRYGESNRQAQKSPHISQHDISNNVQNSASNGNHHLFPSSLEGLLAAPTPRDYSTFNYQAQYGHGQLSAMGSNLGRSYGSEGGLSALATSRPRPFPPPPPLVRLGNSSRSNMVSSEHSVVPKPPGLYPYLQPSITPTACPPWLTRVLEPDWFHEDQNRMDPTHQPSESASLPDSLSRRLSGEHDQCGAINFASGGHIDGAGSSNFVQNSCGVGGGRTFRENCDSNCSSTYREERVVPTHRGSPRLINGPGPPPPPHYPTPPQSSPLQPPSVPVMDCGPITGLPDIYATRTTPNSVVDLCSPPPSPDTRTVISCSPRGSYVPGNGYHPHVVRLVLVDSRYVPAVNIEPHKHNSALAVPISDVVSKFLRGTTVQSCQVILETVFGLHLYECTSLHLEALAKHKVVVDPGSKLVTVPDLRNYLHQLRFLLAEREKRKDRSCDGHTETELPLGKRWCESERES